MRAYRSFVLLFFVLFLGFGCSDTTIDPFQNEDKYFTIWGYIDQLNTQHSVRVIPVTRFAENIVDPSSAEIDAEVYSVDLSTGERRRWIHHLEQLEDGTYGHIFSSSFIVNTKRSYRLEVVRADGKMATAETRVPSSISDTLIVKSPVVWENDSTLVFQDVEIPGIPSPWDISVIYRWEGGIAKQGVYVPYGREGQRTENGGWRFRANISADQPRVEEWINWAIDRGMLGPGELGGIISMGVQVRILDGNWNPPKGVFDPEVLAQPGVLSNVENGYGFFGSVGLYTQEWNTSELSPKLGYDF